MKVKPSTVLLAASLVADLFGFVILFAQGVSSWQAWTVLGFGMLLAVIGVKVGSKSPASQPPSVETYPQANLSDPINSEQPPGPLKRGTLRSFGVRLLGVVIGTLVAFPALFITDSVVLFYVLFFVGLVGTPFLFNLYRKR